ncbi:hypothetical protein Dimus_022260, partial [Dionaea muscipula]
MIRLQKAHRVGRGSTRPSPAKRTETFPGMIRLCVAQPQLKNLSVLGKICLERVCLVGPDPENVGRDNRPIRPEQGQLS